MQVVWPQLGGVNKTLAAQLRTVTDHSVGAVEDSMIRPSAILSIFSIFGALPANSLPPFHSVAEFISHLAPSYFAKRSSFIMHRINNAQHFRSTKYHTYFITGYRYVQYRYVLLFKIREQDSMYS